MSTFVWCARTSTGLAGFKGRHALLNRPRVVAFVGTHGKDDDKPLHMLDTPRANTNGTKDADSDNRPRAFSLATADGLADANLLKLPHAVL